MDLLTLILLVAGLALLIGGAELLVRGAAGLAAAVGISPLVVGLTVVAFGTSAAELAVSLGAAVTGRADIAVGNVVGSNIFNVLVILGLAALVTPLAVQQRLVRLEVPLMIGAAALMLLLGLDGRYGRLDGLLLCAGVVAYTVFAIRKSRQETRAVEAEYAEAFGTPARRQRRLLVQAGWVAAGLAMLVLGAEWLVDGAVAIAAALGIDELIVGLTIVSAGTSLPEAATSVVAGLRGERDIAVGNVVGSNLFNILAVLGLTAAVAPEGVAVARAALVFDLPVMIAVCAACLPVFYSGLTIDRWEGLVFLVYYAAYAGYLVLAALEHRALGPFSTAMLAFVLPITGLTLAVILWRSVRRDADRGPGA